MSNVNFDKELDEKLDIDTEESTKQKKKQQKIIIGVSVGLILVIIITTVCFFCGRKGKDGDITRYNGTTAENPSVDALPDDITKAEDTNSVSERNSAVASILADENVNTSEEEIANFTNDKKDTSKVEKPTGVTEKHFEATTQKQVFHRVEPAK